MPERFLDADCPTVDPSTWAFGYGRRYVPALTARLRTSHVIYQNLSREAPRRGQLLHRDGYSVGNPEHVFTGRQAISARVRVSAGQVYVPSTRRVVTTTDFAWY